MGAAEYLRLARQCIDLVEVMRPSDGPILLDIAEAWMVLATETAAEEHAQDVTASTKE